MNRPRHCRREFIHRGFICLLACFLACGISLGCRSMPTTHYYTLAPPAEEEAAGGGGEGIVLGVEPFRVDPPYDREELVYRVGEGSTEVGFYTYHRWAAPLGHLVTAGLADGLRGVAGLAHVEPASALGDYDAVLRGRVICAEELDLPGRQEAHLELEVQLVVEGEVRWQWRLRGTAEGQVESVDAMVGLFKQAFREVVDGLRVGLVEGLALVEAP